MIQLADIRQSGPSDCGRAAVRCVFDFWGVKAPRDAGVLVDHRDGVHPAAVQAALRRGGLRVVAGEVAVSDLLGLFLKTGRPVICLIQRGGSGHYVTCSGIERRSVKGRKQKVVCYQDPIDGPRSAALAEWARSWHDVDVHGTTYDQFGIVAYPGGPSLACAALVVR